MKGKGNVMVSSLVVPLVLGLVCAGIVAASLAGKTLPLLATPRTALVALLVVGMAACTGGIGQVAASGRWGSPLAIAGYLLGGLILLVTIAGLAGWKLPLVYNPVRAVTAVGVLMAVKFVIRTAGYFLRWL